MTESKSKYTQSFKISLIFVLAAILLIVVVLGFTGGLNIGSFQQNYTESLVSSYAVSGGETLRKIEYAVIYGKPLDNFHGIEELLQERLNESQDLQQVRIILPDGQVIYNQEGALANQVLPEEMMSTANFSMKNDAFDYTQYEGQYHIFLPIHNREGAWLGNLSLVFNESVVQEITREYMSQLIRYLIVMALVAVLFLFLFVSRFSIFTPEGQLRKRRLLVGILVILSVVQIAYGVINYQIFSQAYVQIAEENTSQTAVVVQKDIEFVVNNGVPYDKLYQLENYLENIIDSVPEIASISIATSTGEVLYTTLSEANMLREVESRWLYDQTLIADTSGVQPSIQVQLSSEYVSSKLNGIILDTVTVLVTSFLFMVEITLLVLIFLRRRLHSSLSPISDDRSILETDTSALAAAQGQVSTDLDAMQQVAEDNGDANRTLSSSDSDSDEDEGSIIRPLAFILSIAVFMSAAFIPIVMKNLYDEHSGALFGLSQTVAVALPMSVEMLCAGLATIMAGYLVDRRGWKPAFFIGMFFLACGMLLSGFAWDPLAFIVARGTAGIGYGLSFMAMRAYVNSSKSEKGRTDGVASFLAGLYAGINCGVIVGAMLADRIGFAQVFFVAMFVAALASLFALSFIKNSKPIAQVASDQPRESAVAQMMTFLRNPKIIGFFTLVVIPIAICSMFLDYYFPVYAESIGVSTSDVGRAFLINGLFIVYLGPFLSKYIGRYMSMEKSIIFSGLIVVAGMLVFAVSGSLWAAFVAVILLGISDSFGLVAQNNYFVKLRATQQIGVGKALGYYDNVRKLGQMIGPMAIGVLLFAGIMGIGILGIAFLATLLIFWFVSNKSKDIHVNKQQDGGVGA